LELAVPIWLERLRQKDPEIREMLIQYWADKSADAVAYQGDVLQFGGKKGAAASVFNALARGLAVLATCPGGVVFLGVLWCDRHAPYGRSYDGQICQQCLAESSGNDWLSPKDQLTGLRVKCQEIETAATTEGIL
jgi:hypothetical protein